MPDRVGERWGDATHHDLPQPLHAGPVEHGVRLVDEVDGDLGDVGVHRDHVVGEVGVENAGSTTIRLTQTVTITAGDGKPIATKRTLTLRKARKK
jgi:hypothetical protein